MVVVTKTRNSEAPLNYDPSQFPSFAVTVDVVILTMSDGVLQALLVCRGRRRSKACGRSPAASSAPPRRWTPRRARAARGNGRRRGEPADPVRRLRRSRARSPDERGHRRVPRGPPRRRARLPLDRTPRPRRCSPVSDMLDGRSSSRSTTCGSCATRSSVSVWSSRSRASQRRSSVLTFTLAELRAVYEAVWDVQLDAANFRRSIVAERGLGLPDRTPGEARFDGRRRARRALPPRQGVAARRARSIDKSKGERGSNPMKDVVAERYGPSGRTPPQGGATAGTGPGKVLVNVRATTVNPLGRRLSLGQAILKPRLLRPPPTEAIDRRHRVRRRRRSSGASITQFVVSKEVFGLNAERDGANAEFVCVQGDRRARPQAGRHDVVKRRPPSATARASRGRLT